MAGRLTFAQVRQARVFAWHERHYIYVEDTLLRVVTPAVSTGDQAPLPPMVVRPSALRGTERLLDDGWHHLDGCDCPYCAPQDQEGSEPHKPRNGFRNHGN